MGQGGADFANANAHAWMAFPRYGRHVHRRELPAVVRGLVVRQVGRWFRFDPETSAYYYYEPTIGAYAEIETITTYRDPVENPVPEPTTNADEIPDDDDPPPPEEP